MHSERALDLQFHEVTPDRWNDLECLFKQSRGCRECWNMWWRLTEEEYTRQKGEANRRVLKSIVDSGETPGILAYTGGKPVGWCSISPRSAYPTLQRSPILKPVDETPVWSIVCLHVSEQHRRQGIGTRLLEAAVAYGKKRGAKAIEGYPIEPGGAQVSDRAVMDSLPASAFRRAGFIEIARQSETHPIMRYTVENNQKAAT